MTNKCMKMSKKKSYVISKGYGGKESRESVKSDSPQTSVSSMFLRNSSRAEIPKNERKKSVKRSTRTSLPVRIEKSKDFPSLDIPEDVAVHFGNFYCLGKKSKNNGLGGREGGTTNTELPVHDSPRSEFTRQMVHKLERLAGTEDYARQISALLEETVESPNYLVKPPPDDTFFSHKRPNLTNYPLWYKDPDKMNYRSPSDEAPSSIEMRRENISRSKMHACKSAATSEGVSINGMNEIDSRRTFVIADLDEYDSSSIGSTTTFNSTDRTDDDSDSKELKINISVK